MKNWVAEGIASDVNDFILQDGVGHNFQRISNKALILKDQGESMYPKAVIWQEYMDLSGKEHFNSYSTQNNQEGKKE